MEERAAQYARIWDVFQKYRTLLYCRARSITDGIEPAEEAVAEALVRMLERAARLSELTEPQLLAYAAAAVHNCALDAAQADSRRAGMELPHPAESGEDAGPDPLPQPSAEERVLQSEDRELLRRAMQRLPEWERSLIVRRYYLEYGYDEIASQLGEKPETVRVRLFRIRKKLLKLLEEEGYRHE